MTGRRCTDNEAITISGRSKSWLQRHTCAWCDQTLWRALRFGCGAIYEKCDPSKKDFSANGRTPQVTRPHLCTTCSGRGTIGGFVNATNGYQDYPCPDCSSIPSHHQGADNG